MCLGQSQVQPLCTQGWPQVFSEISSYWCLEYFATLNLLLSFCHVSYLSLPLSFHICSSCPSDIMWEYIPYSRSWMKTLINMRSHAVVAHKKPLCNFISLCSFCCCSCTGEHGTVCIPAEVWERRQSHEGGSGMPLAALPSFPIHPSLPSCLLVGLPSCTMGMVGPAGLRYDNAGTPSHRDSSVVSFSHLISFSIPSVNMILKFTTTQNLDKLPDGLWEDDRLGRQETCVIRTRKHMPGYIYILGAVDLPLQLRGY